MRSRLLSFFLVGAALIFSIVLIVFGKAQPVRTLRTLLVDAASPMMRVAVHAGRRIGSGIEGLTGTSQREKEGSATAISAARQKALERENELLRRALGFKDELGASFVAARVLLYHRELGREFLILDVGREAEVSEGDIVTDEEGLLLGEVVEAGDGFTKVNVASNKGVALPVTLLPLGERALARGIGGRTFSVELIPHDTPVRAGDFLVWAPAERRSRGEIIVGQMVGEAQRAGNGFKTGRAMLLARPERVDRALIVIRQ